jgi:hypothetical protein
VPGSPEPSCRFATPRAPDSLAELNEPDLGEFESYLLNLDDPFDIFPSPDYDFDEPPWLPGECASDSGYASGNSFVVPSQTELPF